MQVKVKRKQKPVINGLWKKVLKLYKANERRNEVK